jgi:geranylgeranyl diphosphate synthase type I
MAENTQQWEPGPSWLHSSSPEFAFRINLINREIERHVLTNTAEPMPLYEAAYHLLRAGGKRLRSLLILLSCEAVGGKLEEAVPIAVAAELIQTASLIRDDIIDRDDLRRGVETVHKKYGNDLAMLAADLLVAQAVLLVGKHGTAELLQHVGSAGVEMCEGEAFDLLTEKKADEDLSTEKYISTVRRKTVAFIEASTRIGSLVGKGAKEQQDALAQYAESLGIAFQIRDDILDVTSCKEVTGKSVRSDLRWMRSNYPLTVALESSSRDDRADCLETLSKGFIDSALDLIHKTRAVEAATRKAESYVQAAKMSVSGQGFPNEHLLKELADSVLARGY